MNDFDIAKRKQLANKRLQATEGLPEGELRVVLDYLYDGHAPVMTHLLEIRGFYHTKKDLHREHQVYLWLAKNKLRGQKLVEFFKNEGGVLGVILKATNYIDNASRNKVNANEAY